MKIVLSIEIWNALYIYKNIFDLLCLCKKQKAIIYCQFLSATGARLHQPESFAATPRVISLSASLRRETWCIIKYVSSGAAQLPYITHTALARRGRRALSIERAHSRRCVYRFLILFASHYRLKWTACKFARWRARQPHSTITSALQQFTEHAVPLLLN
jgi:hypothetical protein